ncbi:aminotransferase class I/II-fold pyridoxal phosphate-dependent enzyme [Candidatus Fermentibacteria bacterium]|nr:aminotransferase class I/II-fold pyridoxal phosphate-dependent enzyme [Candidatus Fermentibacteria bacterium]
MSFPGTSDRARSIQASPIRKLATLADKAKEDGIHVYHLNIGQPDVHTPVEFWDGIHDSTPEVLAYGPSLGIPELRDAICGYYERSDIEIERKNVLITTGGSEAVMFAMMATCDPGDEVICFEPFYTNYNGFATLSSIKLTPVTCNVENGFHLPPMEEIESKINDRTRAILVCNPNNPTGTILTREEVESLADLASRHDLFLMADEVYRDFTFDGRTHYSILELPGMEDRTIVMDSISKRFSSCGARLGDVITRNAELMSCLVKFGQARLCPPTLPQYGAAKIYSELGRDYFDRMIKTYQRRRDVLIEELGDIEGIFFQKPEGAFYATIRIPVEDSDLFSSWLLTDFNIDGSTTMVAPAAGFYATPGLGKDEIRIAYVLNEEHMRMALRIVKQGLEEYNRA